MAVETISWRRWWRPVAQTRRALCSGRHMSRLSPRTARESRVKANGRTRLRSRRRALSRVFAGFRLQPARPLHGTPAYSKLDFSVTYKTYKYKNRGSRGLLVFLDIKNEALKNTCVFLYVLGFYREIWKKIPATCVDVHQFNVNPLQSRRNYGGGRVPRSCMTPAIRAACGRGAFGGWRGRAG